MRDIFDADAVAILLHDPKTNLIHTQYEYDKGEGGYVDYVEPFTLGTGLTSKIIASRQPLLLGTSEEQEALGAYLAPELLEQGSSVTTQSWLGVPIIVGDKVLGVVMLSDYEPNAYNENHVRLLQTLSSNMGVAIENARLFDETQRLLKETEQRKDELAILNSVGEAMARTLDVKTVTRIVGDKVRDIFDADVVGILLLEAQTNLIHNIYEYDKGEGGYLDYIEPIPLGTGLTSKVIASRQPLLLGTVEQQAAEGAYLAPESLEKGSGVITQSWLGVPIIVGERVLGVVVLSDYDPYAYNENHVRLLQTLSANMGVAIENARLFQAEQERVAELAIINSVQACACRGAEHPGHLRHGRRQDPRNLPPHRSEHSHLRSSYQPGALPVCIRKWEARHDSPGPSSRQGDQRTCHPHP